MFFESVLQGLGTLTNWRVLVVLVLYIIARFLWLFGVGLLAGDSESSGRQLAGCLTHLIGGSLYYVVLIGLIVYFLTPILIGGKVIMPISMIGSVAWPLFKSCLLALGVTFILQFIPLIGDLISKTPGISDFIQGIIIFRLYSLWIIDGMMEIEGIESMVYPGFWNSVGYFIIALILVILCVFAFSMLGTKLSRNDFSDDESVSFFIGTAIMHILGVIPLFMYAMYVELSLDFLTL